MYNPFKWHIIKYRNRFILRKLRLLGFCYLDKTDAQVLLLSLKVERV